MSTILVTGATGTLGAPVVERLHQTDHQVHTLSRHPDPQDPNAHAVDLRTGEGLDTALTGVDTVVHCASSPTGGDLQAATHLLRAARANGVTHLVYVSIVGCDSVPLGYYRTKHTVEEALLASGLGVTVLRATQFHQLVAAVCARAARLPVMPYPDVDVQPVDPGEVALRLVRLAQQEPSGRVPDLGGPRVESFHDLARAYLDATGASRRLLPVRLPGATFAAFRAGGHLAPEHAVGRTTFAEFLARS
ncbi:SDR family oxidoreductase [Nocardiopsis sp. B62]|uniref:SDR family oxidoreductase n=1 Tax=Nocardiopsis sp. B62 TaxID=2824874 RepID=UPI001B35FC23|nr:NAD(P)H-binding protein [Nocardiopsis sp. B62]MBQ1079921.1 NAD(P)H-binding protein [Nocardiopsis sp. B62]